MTTLNTIPSTGFLRLKQIICDSKNGIPPIFPISARTWWTGCASGRYPAPVKIGARATAWRVEDVRKLIADGVKT
jgi:prophage regulatory protein